MRDFDPAAGLTRETRQRMGGPARVARWAARQKSKALHIGTYEAAIHNMLRRIDDQGDRERQFYLYRVRLLPTAVVRPGWVIDPGGFMGDVKLADICPPGTDVVRYLNVHEDPGGISLALGRNAIGSTQRIRIPRQDPDSWTVDAARALLAAGPGSTDTSDSSGFARRRDSPRESAAQQIATALADRLPVNLREQFESAAVIAPDQSPNDWARRVYGLFNLIENSGQALANLEGTDSRRPG